MSNTLCTHTDTAPSNEGETKSVKVCQVGFSGPCERTHNIQMTNCGKYYVYELIPLDICNAAYCFGKIYSIMFCFIFFEGISKDFCFLEKKKYEYNCLALAG